MMQIILIGLGAGAAATLLFASVISGSLTAIFLFYLAPLPILIAALGWSQWAGLIAAVSSAIAIGAFSGFFLISVFVIAFGAWWLGYLSLLARPVANGSGDGLEWYPVGRLVLWAAVIGTLIVAAAIPNFGTDQESLQAGLRKIYGRILQDQSVVDMLVVAVPPAAAVFSTIINVFNLWLAGRIVKLSGRLKRPWPEIAAMTMPVSAMAALAAAIAGFFLPDLVGILSGVLAASLFMAFAILGYAVLHTITYGMASRVFLLAGAYAAALVFFWPIVAVALLGLSETAFNIRGRIAGKGGPPSLRT
jgi:hypothetical protein